METKEKIIADLGIKGKVQSFRGMEGYGFNANLLYKGRWIALVIDDANGGCFNYEIVGAFDKDSEGNYVPNDLMKENQELMKELENRIKQLPEEYNETYNFSFKIDLDTLVNEVVSEYEVMQKYKNKGILLTDGSIIKWKNVTSLSAILKTRPSFIQSINAELKKFDASEVLNADHLRSLGANI